MQTTRPWKYPSIRPEFCRIANQIAGTRRALRFPWNGQVAGLTLSALSSEQGHASAQWTMDISLGEHSLTVHLHQLPDVGWISPALAGIDLAELPHELASAVLETCFAEALNLLVKSGIAISIQSIKKYRPAHVVGDECLHWNVQRGDEKNWMYGSLSGDDSALHHLASLVGKSPANAGVIDESISLPIKLVAGRMSCPVSLLQELSPGDVLLADVQDYLHQHTCELFSARHAIGVATINQNTVTIKQLYLKEQQRMENDSNASLPVDELEIELTFLVGQTTLTLSELRNLAPGTVFELPSSVSQAVTVCANGRAIGRGELLEVGDRVGVRVVEFSRP